MKDRVAIVPLRRLLLELGHVPSPEDLHSRVGPLPLWIAQPRPDLDGKSSMAALAEPDGKARLRQCLLRPVAGGRFEAAPAEPAQAAAVAPAGCGTSVACAEVSAAVVTGSTVSATDSAACGTAASPLV